MPAPSEKRFSSEWFNWLGANGMQTMDDNMHDKHRPGHSACAAASRRLEMERARRLTVEARIKAALGMQARFAWLKPVAIENGP